jgi:hypothetical protein
MANCASSTLNTESDQGMKPAVGCRDNRSVREAECDQHTQNQGRVLKLGGDQGPHHSTTSMWPPNIKYHSGLVWLLYYRGRVTPLRVRSWRGAFTTPPHGPEYIRSWVGRLNAEVTPQRTWVQIALHTFTSPRYPRFNTSPRYAGFFKTST